MIKMIVAVDAGNAIGWTDGRLPWKIPHDMKRFKELTTGGTVVMGFNTFKSLGRPSGLPNRKNIVLSRKPWSEARTAFAPDSDIDVISSLDWVVQAEQRGGACTSRDLWIIGGASVYDEALDRGMVDELYMTVVQVSSGADVSLKHDLATWKLFVIRQAAKGIEWDLTEFTPVPPTEDVHGTVYITLKKRKS